MTIKLTPFPGAAAGGTSPSRSRCGYPGPAVISLGLWMYIVVTGPVAGMVVSVAFVLASVAAY